MSIIRFFDCKAFVLQSLLVCFLLVLTGCEQQQAPVAAKPPMVVISEPINQEIVEWDDFVGRIDPIEFVEVRARVSGYLESVDFEEGQIVKQGDILCLIDPRPFQVEVQRAEAEVLSATSMEQQASAAIPQSSAEVQEAQARYDLAVKQFERSGQLANQNAVSRDELDIRDAEMKRAQANLSSIRARLEVAKSAVETAKAQVNTAKSTLAGAQLNLEYCHIRSPITGRISSRQVTEGNLISGGSTGSTLITTIVSINPIHCYFDVDEASFLKYERLAREGKMGSSRDVKNPVYVGLADESKDYPHAGHIDFVDNRLDTETGTMRLRAILRNDNSNLTPGLFTRVRIPGSAKYHGILVPDFAIGTDQSDKYVFTVNDQNKIERHVVQLGPMYRGMRIIRSGLEGHEKVVIRGQQSVRTGSEVTTELRQQELKEDLFPMSSDPVPEPQWIPRSPRTATKDLRFSNVQEVYAPVRTE